MSDSGTPWYRDAIIYQVYPRGFHEGRRDRNSPYHNYYVWSDTAEEYASTRVIFKDTHDSNWSWDNIARRYYWHRFYSHQPDLNYDNPAVQDEVLNVIKFWLDR